MSNVLLTYYFLNSWLGSDHGPGAGFWQPHHRGLHIGGPGGGRSLFDHHSAIPLQCAACGHHAPGWRDVRAQQCASLAVSAPALTCHFVPLQTLCGQKCWEGHGTPLFSPYTALSCVAVTCAGTPLGEGRQPPSPTQGTSCILCTPRPPTAGSSRHKRAPCLRDGPHAPLFYLVPNLILAVRVALTEMTSIARYSPGQPQNVHGRSHKGTQRCT